MAKSCGFFKAHTHKESPKWVVIRRVSLKEAYIGLVKPLNLLNP